MDQDHNILCQLIGHILGYPRVVILGTPLYYTILYHTFYYTSRSDCTSSGVVPK